MLQQLVTHTPVYVWAILAVLVWRGSAALRERQMRVRSLFIVPLVMLALSLQDVLAKFGASGIAFGAWTLGAAAGALLVWRFGHGRSVPGAAPGTVVVPGSWVPLAMMMAIFFTKYAAAVLLAVLPQARQDALAMAAVCALFGLFSGCFLGRLAHDLAGLRQAGDGAPALARAIS